VAINDGIGNPVRDPFPGVSSGADSTGASGSYPSSPDVSPGAAVPSGDSGIPGVGTTVPLSSQAGPGHSTSTAPPGTTATSAISPGPYEGYVSTGAGGGNANPNPHPNE